MRCPGCDQSINPSWNPVKVAMGPWGSKTLWCVECGGHADDLFCPNDCIGECTSTNVAMVIGIYIPIETTIEQWARRFKYVGICGECFKWAITAGQECNAKIVKALAGENP